MEMKAIKTILKYVGWPIFIFGFLFGMIVMYNINGNREALYNVKDYCFGENCAGFKQLLDSMNQMCNNVYENTVYFDGGCVKSDDIKNCLSENEYLTCLSMDELKEKRDVVLHNMRSYIPDYIYQLRELNEECHNKVDHIENSLSLAKKELKKCERACLNHTEEVSYGVHNVTFPYFPYLE